MIESTFKKCLSNIKIEATKRILEFSSYDKAKEFAKDLLGTSSEIEEIFITVNPYSDALGIHDFDKIFVKFEYFSDIPSEQRIFGKLLTKYFDDIVDIEWE